jgi:hypothetical protein
VGVPVEQLLGSHGRRKTIDFLEEAAMKRAAVLFSLLTCSGLLLADSPDPGRAPRKPVPLVEDLARLTKAGLSDETVLDYAKAHRAEAPSLIEADDLVWLRKAGVSESVIRYMTAIDVRSPDQSGGEDIAYESAESAESAGYPSAAYSSSDYSDYGYADNGSYYGYPDTYAYGAYPDTYYADYYPFFGVGYYPYPAYFFVNNAGFFGRFGRHHRFGRHRDRFNGHDHGRFGHSRTPRGGFDRGTGGRRGGAMFAHRGPVSPGFPRRSFGPGFVGPRGAVSGRGGIGRPITRGESGHGFRAPQGVPSRGAIGHPAFAGGSRAGGGFGRGPTPSFRGAPRPVGRSGGRVGR